MKVWGYQSIWWHYWWWVNQVAGFLLYVGGFLLYVGHFFVISVTSWSFQGVGSILCCWDSCVACCCFTITILFVHSMSLWELWGIQVEQILPLLHLPMCLFLIMHRLSVLLVFYWMAKILRLGADLFVFILVVRESRAGFWVLRSNQPPLIRSVFNGIWIIAPSWVGFFNYMDERTYNTFMYQDIINSLWTILCQMYVHARNGAGICELYWDVYHASQAALGLSVVDYFGYLQSRWEELAQYEPLSDFPADAASIVASRLNRQHTY